ncbi:cation transporter [Pseudalkalibacillus decolorationis]|uniref:cation transporter n=1 Tax=Pseudalkalibacillus decolorationis TaxID=163879 RepID=UPI0021496D13|nr:cation transporter [Pseudalkalibacillus decolorationis]
MKTVDLRVEGMSCGLCIVTIEGVLQEIGTKGKVDLKTSTVTVEYDENSLSLEKIKEAIDGKGYEVI